jgi:hypothetical protein
MNDMICTCLTITLFHQCNSHLTHIIYRIPRSTEGANTSASPKSRSLRLRSYCCPTQTLRVAAVAVSRLARARDRANHVPMSARALAKARGKQAASVPVQGHTVHTIQATQLNGRRLKRSCGRGLSPSTRYCRYPPTTHFCKSAFGEGAKVHAGTVRRHRNPVLARREGHPAPLAVTRIPLC